MKLFIFDTATKKLVGQHNFWDDSWIVADNWKTFDSGAQVALKVADDVNDMDTSGFYIQPVSYASPETTDHEYIDPDILFPPPE